MLTSPYRSLLTLRPNRSYAVTLFVIRNRTIALEPSIRTAAAGQSKCNALLFSFISRFCAHTVVDLLFRTCGECLPQCCFKNKGNCPNNIDNAQCNVGPEEPPPAPTPTPPPFNRRAPSYCFVEPDISCYPNTSGRPGCCWDDGGSYCPSFQPGCQAQPIVMEYCTYFDYNCYPQDGKPACCFQDGGMECPYQKPPCQRQPNPRGQNYCTWGFDYSCYPQLGRPQCCFENNGDFCPPEPEPCVATTPTPKGGPPPPNTNPPGPNPRPPPPNDDKKNLRFKALKGIDS